MIARCEVQLVKIAASLVQNFLRASGLGATTGRAWTCPFAPRRGKFRLRTGEAAYGPVMRGPKVAVAKPVAQQLLMLFQPTVVLEFALAR